MKKILVAVDGSPASIHAAKKAQELAGDTRAELTLVYVAPPLMTPGDVTLDPFVMTRDMALARGGEILKDVSKALELPGVLTKNLLGPAVETIADLADSEEFDLVVVGNTGRGAVSRVLLGSVADRLVHICKRPVMVVR